MPNIFYTHVVDGYADSVVDPEREELFKEHGAFATCCSLRVHGHCERVTWHLRWLVALYLQRFCCIVLVTRADAAIFCGFLPNDMKELVEREAMKEFTGHMVTEKSLGSCAAVMGAQ